MKTAIEIALELVASGVFAIDEHGRVWRKKAIVRGQLKDVSARRAESIGGNGYFRLMLWHGGKLHGVGAHRVVWAHFNGPIPDGLQINHKDGNKKNNDPANLETVTGAENIQHSYANGRPKPWNTARMWREGRPRLSVSQIYAARRMRERGALLKEIAARFGIGTTHAHRLTA